MQAQTSPPNAAPPGPWIAGPGVDLGFFSFGWIAAFAGFVAIDASPASELGRPLAILWILIFNFLHRHLTFPLIYLDPEQFRARRVAYLTLPVFFLALSVVAVRLVEPPELVVEPAGSGCIGRTSAQTFVFERPDAVRESVLVRFAGHECTTPAIGAAVSRGLAGRLSLEANGDGFRYRLDGAPVGTRFFLGASFGDGALPARLGLAPMTWYGLFETRPLLILLGVLAVVWTIYHSLKQKLGLLRIYARKVGTSDARLDHAFVFSWFGWLVLHLGSLRAVREQAAATGRTGHYAAAALTWAAPWLEVCSAVALVIAVVVTVLYLRAELRGHFSWPRTAYAASILMLYATFHYDLIVGYAVFGFSHALEYVAFVNVYVRRKYAALPARSSLLARAVRRQALSMTLYVGAIVPAFLITRELADSELGWYITGSGFLHFIYDGWIWKMRKPDVGRPLGLSYAAR